MLECGGKVQYIPYGARFSPCPTNRRRTPVLCPLITELTYLIDLSYQ
jgi:hypothetical protein